MGRHTPGYTDGYLMELIGWVRLFEVRRLCPMAYADAEVEKELPQWIKSINQG